MINFLARLGWSHGDQEIFTREELLEFFSFDHVQKSGAVFNAEKLLWLNGEHIRKADPERLQKILVQDFASAFPGECLARARGPIGKELIRLIQPKVKLLKEMVEQLIPLVTPGTVDVDPSGLKWKDPAAKPAILAAVGQVADLLGQKIAAAGTVGRGGLDPVWGQGPSLAQVGMGHAEIDGFLRQVCETGGLKLGDLAQPIRLAVTGRLVSAGLFEILALLPWSVVEPRLRKAADF
jgi:glutamyl-tRNA synthetase